MMARGGRRYAIRSNNLSKKPEAGPRPFESNV
jgi:hypothetical protein